MRLSAIVMSLSAASALVAFGCYGGSRTHYEVEYRQTYARPVEREAAPPPVEREEAAVPADEQVDVTEFHDQLAPSGEWVEAREYGSVWVPRGVAVGWQPYTIGHWAFTDDHGWLWVSEEPWGWATYHYGRWVTLEGRGWCWVPGRVWAPAWVVWRNGGGYCGWAPLPPRRAGLTIEINIGAIPASHFCFIEERHITEPRIHERIVNVRENTTIITKTTNITRVEVVNKKVVNRGVRVEEVEKVSGKKVEHVQVKEVHSRADAKEVRGKEVSVYRPQPKARVQPERKPAERTVDRPTVDRPTKPEVRPPVKEERRPTAAETAERKRAEEAYVKERKVMDDRHAQERQRRPAGASEAELAKRHEAEKRQLDEKHHRPPAQPAQKQEKKSDSRD
jgi:hypothetical protein